MNFCIIVLVANHKTKNYLSSVGWNFAWHLYEYKLLGLAPYAPLKLHIAYVHIFFYQHASFIYIHDCDGFELFTVNGEAKGPIPKPMR